MTTADLIEELGRQPINRRIVVQVDNQHYNTAKPRVYYDDLVLDIDKKSNPLTCGQLYAFYEKYKLKLKYGVFRILKNRIFRRVNDVIESFVETDNGDEDILIIVDRHISL